MSAIPGNPPILGCNICGMLFSAAAAGHLCARKPQVVACKPGRHLEILPGGGTIHDAPSDACICGNASLRRRMGFDKRPTGAEMNDMNAVFGNKFTAEVCEYFIPGQTYYGAWEEPF